MSISFLNLFEAYFFHTFVECSLCKSGGTLSTLCHTFVDVGGVSDYALVLCLNGCKLGNNSFCNGNLEIAVSRQETTVAEL